MDILYLIEQAGKDLKEITELTAFQYPDAASQLEQGVNKVQAAVQMIQLARRPFTGSVSEVKMHDHALTAAEIITEQQGKRQTQAQKEDDHA